MLNTKEKKEASDGLQEIVDKFNKDFYSWMERTGCRANIGWKYSKSNEAIKQLEIQSIDLEVYRKPPPEFLSMQEGRTLDRTNGPPPSGEPTAKF